jgi:hypothetical protein
MKPALSIATHVNVGCKNQLNFFLCRINTPNVGASVVSPYKLWLAALCFILFPSARGTAVAVIVTSDAIFIAADGAGSFGSPTTPGVETVEPYCKIHRQGEIFYVAAGFYESALINFNVRPLARDAAKHSRAMLEIYGLIEPAVLKKIPAIVQLSKVHDPDGYARYLAGTAPVLDLAFGSFENGNPIVVAVSFRVDNRGAPIKPVEAVLRVSQTIPMQKLLLGYNERMAAASDLHRSPSWGSKFRRDPINVIERLIQLEIDAAKQEGRKDVGPPISIVKITKAAGGWEKGHEGACP